MLGKMKSALRNATAILLTLASTLQGDEPQPDYLQTVKAYADTMLDHGQDTYGQEHTPLFAEELNPSTMQMLEGKALEKVAAIDRENWGIRSHDRMLGGANPQHCLNLYQILYALTKITGEKRYAAEADRSLTHFFENCQSDATGILYWGEHAGWDLRTNAPLEKRSGDIHEFFRPWILWNESWQLAPKPCRQFALGLWEHQIGDHETGDFSRHATISKHGPGTNAPYARHGGFYIETWAIAYSQTKDKVYLQAIRSVIEGLERARLHEGGYLVGGSTTRGGRRPYDVSLAISAETAAAHVPQDLATRLREVARANDEVFSKTVPDMATASAQKVDAEALWSNAYGAGPRAGRANVYMLRYRQSQNEAYRRATLQEADLYRNHDIDLTQPVWPGTIGDAIWLMLNGHELTSDDIYLQAADTFAQKAVATYLDLGPLPRASQQHTHYEAVTNGDTLMMALLKLSLVQNPPESSVDLTYTNR
jgi:pectate lyase-like protein